MPNSTAFTSGEASHLSTIPGPVLHHWARIGLLKPSVRVGRGAGSPKLYSLSDICAMAAMDFLRRRGVVRLDALEPVAKLIQQQENIDQLPAGTMMAITIGGKAFLCQAYLNEGRRGEDGPEVAHLTFEIPKAEAGSVEEWGGGIWALLDLSNVVDQVLDAIVEMNETQEAAAVAAA